MRTIEINKDLLLALHLLYEQYNSLVYQDVLTENEENWCSKTEDFLNDMINTYPNHKFIWDTTSTE